MLQSIDGHAAETGLAEPCSPHRPSISALRYVQGWSTLDLGAIMPWVATRDLTRLALTRALLRKPDILLLHRVSDGWPTADQVHTRAHSQLSHASAHVVPKGNRMTAHLAPIWDPDRQMHLFELLREYVRTGNLPWERAEDIEAEEQTGASSRVRTIVWCTQAADMLSLLEASERLELTLVSPEIATLASKVAGSQAGVETSLAPPWGLQA